MSSIAVHHEDTKNTKITKKYENIFVLLRAFVVFVVQLDVGVTR
jgi:hypothetical protein